MTFVGPANYVNNFPEFKNVAVRPIATPTPLDSVKEASERIAEVTTEIRAQLEKRFPKSNFDISFSFDERNMVAIRVISNNGFELSDAQQADIRKSLWRFKCEIGMVSTKLPSGGTSLLIGTNLQVGPHIRKQNVIDNLAKKNPPGGVRG